jgi:hypothetical protein
MAKADSRLSASLSDVDLKTLLKEHMPESPLKSLSFYRNAELMDICEKHERFLVEVANKQSRLNKIQLGKLMYDLHKGEKVYMNDVAGKLAAAYSAALAKRKNTTSGKKTPAAAMNIIRAFHGSHLPNEQDVVELQNPQPGSAGPACPGENTAEEVLRKARERFGTLSPPSKKNVAVDRPFVVEDSPLQASLQIRTTYS